ncbi:hypothetical protein CC86DRAFT_115197 [Ophiobolus disseminans]|uniref:Uncharacterized protein n=1 Tax=Ophiobolus disseminans TaxID=1469910 RepID=A0A6A6ZI76_9PLEO|nr:hypothetical protein CC86DRAFT_115197 [Ophiobolus disseminans]
MLDELLGLCYNIPLQGDVPRNYGGTTTVFSWTTNSFCRSSGIVSIPLFRSMKQKLYGLHESLEDLWSLNEGAAWTWTLVVNCNSCGRSTVRAYMSIRHHLPAWRFAREDMGDDADAVKRDLPRFVSTYGPHGLLFWKDEDWVEHMSCY